jgi:hypothetical protein
MPIQICVRCSLLALPRGQHLLWVLSDRGHHNTYEANSRTCKYKSSVPAPGCPRPSMGPQMGPTRIQGLELGGDCSHPEPVNATQVCEQCGGLHEHLKILRHCHAQGTAPDCKVPRSRRHDLLLRRVLAANTTRSRQLQRARLHASCGRPRMRAANPALASERSTFINMQLASLNKAGDTRCAACH